MSTPELGGGGSSSRKSLASGGSASTGASRLKSTDEVDYQRGRKRGRDASMDKEEEGSKKPEFKIVVPNHLKVKLIDDWEKITKDKLLIPLPRTPNVSQLFEKYYKYITENPEKRRNK
ncbi:Chromatin modification-related protein EAF3 [Zancudomyces culisetae]|uniref:Chromatin modification-related protein EAF3 n=1 Tax=Zancudomyces culisetae TaxID=1213189 RepID=A0A1R1PPP7_ZANCU|nr:Chromatin modification-related protein EAF3 [Zancudomyces culisetae]|eukprot:OMH82937.1 Chromatin modification-related protein EAF3 [Zancudomyces culisetae]